MRLLYKYYSVDDDYYSVENLSNGVVCFSDLQKFNDPFEGFGDFKFDVAPEDAEYWRSIGSDIHQNIADRFSEDSKEAVRRKNRILCVTEKHDNPLMWAHYANSHTGFCVGYAEEEIDKISDKFRRVSYEQQPHKINLNSLDMDEVENLLFVKSDEWKYEEEWRALYTLKENDVSNVDFGENVGKCYTDEDKDKIYTQQGYPSAGEFRVEVSNRYILKKCEPQIIYLGLRMKKEHRECLIKIAKAKQIKLCQMLQQPNSFRMKTIELYP